MGSDIRVYFATVAIDSGGFEGLRPGLSAEVSFFVDAKREATRLPLQAVRWVDHAAVRRGDDLARAEFVSLAAGQGRPDERVLTPRSSTA